MFRRVTIRFLFLIFLFPQIASAQKLWQEMNSGISDTDIRSISAFYGDDNLVCATSADNIYFSENGGNFWRKLFSLGGQADEINFVVFDLFNPDTLYAATTKGLFITTNQGEIWQRVFRKISEAANNVAWIAQDLLDVQKIYIGTEDALYISCDSAASWRKAGGGLPHSPVRAIAVHPANSQILYLANTYGLFKSIDTGESWKRIYVTSYKVTEDENEDENEEPSQINENQNLINGVVIDKYNPKKIFIATGCGVFVSPDAGGSWNKLPAEGLTCDYVNFIVVSSGKTGLVYAATKEGVFEFLPKLNRWQELYQGKTFRDARALTLNMDGKQLFAGTDRGFFKTVDMKYVQKPQEEKEEIVEKKKIDLEQVLKELSSGEPTIHEVQEAALRYAEVIHPERIKILRRDARLKAFLPTVSLDYDKTITGYSGGDFYVGPRDWGLSLSWDVGDLVFNSQVRLIDGQTRLMLQTRDDILNEITRLYYERRKLQTEFILTPPETSEQKLTKTLRLEELTANIDALTGGYFSRHLKNYKK